MSTSTSMTICRGRLSTWEPSRFPEVITIQQRVLNVALVRLSESLVAPCTIGNDSVESICSQLGISQQDLVGAVGERLEEERRRLHVGDDGVYSGQGDSASVQQVGVNGDISSGDDASQIISTKLLSSDTSTRGIMDTVVQELCLVFFAQEVLQGERALEDARARLAALWDKLVELATERDQMLERLMATPEQRDMFTALARTLEQAHEEQERLINGCSRAASWEREGFPFSEDGACLLKTRSSATLLPLQRNEAQRKQATDDDSSLPAAVASSPSSSTSSSRLRPPRAGRKHCPRPNSSTASTSSSSSSNTSEDEFPRRSHAPMLSVCTRCGEMDGGHNEKALASSAGGLSSPGGAVASPRRAGGSGGAVGNAFAEALRRSHGSWSQDLKELRNERNVLMRRLSSTRERYTDALNAKPDQDERLTQEIHLLRRASDALRVELDDEKRRKAEEVTRWQREAAAMKHKFTYSAKRADEEGRGRAIAEARIASIDAEHACLVEALKQKAQTFEAKSRSLSTEIDVYQGRLDDALCELEELRGNCDGKSRADENNLRETLERSGQQAATATGNANNQLQGLLETAHEKAFEAERNLSVDSEDAVIMKQRHTMAVRSSVWEADVARREDVSNVAMEKAELTQIRRKELRVALGTAKRELGAAEQELAFADRLRAEEAAVSRERMLALDEAQGSVRRLTKELLEIKAASSTEAALVTNTATAADWAAERDSLLDDLIEAEEHLCEVEEERDEALRAVRGDASVGNDVRGERYDTVSCDGRDHNDDGTDSVRAEGVRHASCRRRFHDDSVDNNTDGDHLRASVDGEKLESTVALRGDSSSDHGGAAYGDATAPTRHGQSSRLLGDGVAVNALSAPEGTEVRETVDTLVVSDDGRNSSDTTGLGLPTETEVSRHSVDFVRGSGDGESCDNERVCSTCGAPASASRKLSDALLELGRMRTAIAEANARVVKANERAATASGDTKVSRYDRHELERSLGDRNSELKEARADSRRLSTLAEGIAARLAAAEGLRAELEAELARERERTAALAVDTECRTNEALAASTAKCDAAQAALDDCRTALAERSHELRGVHQILAARDEVETAAREAALGEAIASAEGLARPSQETGDLQEKLLAEESRRRRVEADLEEANEALNATMVRCKEAEEAAAMAGEKAKAQWEADLAIAEEKRDTLMELQRRIAEVENEKSERKRLEQAEQEKFAAVQRLTQAVTCHLEQIDSDKILRQGLEKRLTAAEDAVVVATAMLDTEKHRAANEERALKDEIRRASKAARAEAAAAEAREAENMNTAANEVTGVTEELANSVQASTLREGEVAVLRARLQSTEDEIDSVRREALLEGRARSVAEMAEAGKRDAAFRAEVEALKVRCEDQRRALATLASSREEEADACQVARTALAKEKMAMAKVQSRVRELELEVGRMSCFLESNGTATSIVGNVLNVAAVDRMRDDRQQPLGPLPTQAESPANSKFRRRHDQQQYNNGNYVRGNCMSEAAPAAAWTSWDDIRPSPIAGPRESKERERTRNVFSALEESARTSREEADVLTRRIAQLRGLVRKAEWRADEMEAAAAAARASAAASAEASKTATAEAEIATAGRHEAEQKARDAERRCEERTVALESDIQRVQGAAKVVQVEVVEARKELSRIRRELGDSDKRAAALHEELARLAADLRAAEAGKIALQMDLLRRLGERGGRGGGGGNTGGSSVSFPVGMNARQGHVAFSTSAVTRFSPLSSVLSGVRPSPVLPNHRVEVELGGINVEHCGRGGEKAILRQRLAASQTHFTELIKASEEAVANCNKRCDARTRAALAAGTLVSACCRRRGIEAGRDEAVIAAARLDLVRRCFGALRTEALRSSRDRIGRRHETIRRWVKEAVQVAGEELFLLKNQ